jgi:nuclear exosome regulator NRDE2
VPFVRNGMTDFVDLSRALKLSKSILASFPNSLRLWSVHAHLQRIRGKTDLARKVYQACLLSPPPASSSWLFEANAADRMYMWWCWAEMEWLERRDDDAMRLLLSAVGISMPLSDPNPTSSSVSIQIPLLRARKAYDRALMMSNAVAPGTTVATMNPKTYISVLNCFALLEILHTRSVSATLELYTQYQSSPASLEPAATSSATTRSRRFLDETLTVSSSLLILHFTHTLRNVSPPALLRKHVSEAMRRYPGNSILLGVWLESERGEAVWGRVRSGVADVVLGQGVKEGRRGKGVSVTRVLWSVWVEKWERGVWDGRKARHVLRNGVEDPRLDIFHSIFHDVIYD